MTIKNAISSFFSIFKKKKIKEQISKDDIIANHISYVNSELIQLKLFIEDEIEKFIMKKVVKQAKDSNTLN